MEIAEAACWSRDAERMVLGTVFCDSDRELLGRLEPEDFFDPFHRWLLNELKLHAETTAPFCDSVSWVRHLSSPGCAGRWQSFVQEHGDQGTSPDSKMPYGFLAAEVFGDFVTAANREYHLRVLRKERMNRALRLLAVKLLERTDADRDSPMRHLEWLTSSTSRLMRVGVAALADVDPNIIED